MTNKEFFISSWQRESAVLAKAIRALPTDMSKLNIKHHPKFRSPWELVNHISPHGKEAYQAITEGRSDLVNEGMFDLNSPTVYKSLEDAAKDVETYSQKLANAVAACSDADWTNKQVDVFWGTQKIMTTPLMQFAWMMHFDVVHHLGQLTSYYRVIGVTQPSLKGPTTEEEEAMMAASK